MTSVHSDDFLDAEMQEFEREFEDVDDFDRSENFRPPKRAWSVRRLLLSSAAIVGAAVMFFVSQRLVWAVVHDSRQVHAASEFGKSKAAIGEGDVLGVIQAADIELNEVFAEGSTVDNLRAGPTHRSGTGLPGEAGVMIIDGHATSYGGPFSRITKLKPGNVVAVQARFGAIVPYVVKETKAVKATSDLSEAPKDGVARLVLVTSSDSFTGGPLRMVIAETTSVLRPSDASAKPSTGLPPQTPLRWSTFMALVTLFVLPTLWRYLKHQVARWLAVALSAPVVLLGLVQVIMTIDRVLPRFW
jgi:LPXTG-site transpeptidase (sortase) family protein